MEGGNVAGRGGGTYDSNTNTFNSGDGTSVGGGKLEDFVPNTTTTLPSAVTTLPSAVGVVTSDGQIYENKVDYLKGESLIEVRGDLIEVTIPNTFESGTKYSLSFNPDGRGANKVISKGLVSNFSDAVVKLSSPMALQQKTSASSGLRLTIRKSFVGMGSGRLTVKLIGSRGNTLFQVNWGYRPTLPKIYSTCASLRRDFSSGVSFAAIKTSSSTLSSRVKYGRPIVDKYAYVANKRLDFDKDKIVCER